MSLTFQDISNFNLSHNYSFIYFNLFIDLQTRRDVVYLVSKRQDTRSKNANTEIDNFTILDVFRPATSISIEEILVEKVVEFHKNFCSDRNSEISIFGRNDNSSTLNAVRTYIRTYNTITDKIKSKNMNNNKNENNNENIDEHENDDQTKVMKGSNVPIKSEANDVENVYHNSPLRKTKENEEEIERHRQSRKKSGRAYNQIEMVNIEDGNFNNQGSGFIQISMPLFLLSMGVVSVLSYLVGKSSKA